MYDKIDKNRFINCLAHLDNTYSSHLLALITSSYGDASIFFSMGIIQSSLQNDQKFVSFFYH